MAIINQHPAFSNLGNGGIREIPVTDSSFLTMFKYDPNGATLTVVFKNGAEYLHQSVYGMTVDQLMESPNKSEFYLKNIRGKTPSTRIINKTVGPRGGFHGKPNSNTRSGANARGKGGSKPNRSHHRS